MKVKDKELRVGVVGYCPPTKFDEKKALEYIKDAYNRIANGFQNHEITVVSGLTNLGIPVLAYKEAVKRNWRTIGIACSKAKKYDCFPVDERIIVGENWGDESLVFLNSINIMVRIGGGKQSLEEVAEMKKRGKFVLEYELEKLE